MPVLFFYSKELEICCIAYAGCQPKLLGRGTCHAVMMMRQVSETGCGDRLAATTDMIQATRTYTRQFINACHGYDRKMIDGFVRYE